MTVASSQATPKLVSAAPWLQIGQKVTVPVFQDFGMAIWNWANSLVEASKSSVEMVNVVLATSAGSSSMGCTGIRPPVDAGA